MVVAVSVVATSALSCTFQNSGPLKVLAGMDRDFDLHHCQTKISPALQLDYVSVFVSLYIIYPSLPSALSFLCNVEVSGLVFLFWFEIWAPEELAVK
jgi:hypothetical protein